MVERPDFMRILSVTFFLILSFHVNGQTGMPLKEDALNLAREAIRLMDAGQIKESIKLLQKADSLDPGHMLYPYEIAYAHYQDKNYDESIRILESLINHAEADPTINQLLGNSFDMKGEKDKAISTYEDGMKRYPNSGRLYLEAGVVERSRDDHNAAIAYWEKGIKVEPNYPSNYYWLARTFGSTDERVWSMLYGELFIILEPNTDRTTEISQLMYKNYQESVQVNSDSLASFSMTEKGYNIVLEDKKDLRKLKKGKLKLLPFEGTFAMSYAVAALNFMNSFDLPTIHSVRSNFLKNWFKENAKDYPNALLSYQKKMEEAGVFETYSYFLTYHGDYEFFKAWYNENLELFEKFTEWFNANPINLVADQKYSRLDY